MADSPCLASAGRSEPVRTRFAGAALPSVTGATPDINAAERTDVIFANGFELACDTVRSRTMQASCPRHALAGLECALRLINGIFRERHSFARDRPRRRRGQTDEISQAEGADAPRRRRGRSRAK